MTANVTISLILVASCRVIIMAGHFLHQPDSPKITLCQLSLFLNAIFTMALFFVTCDVMHCTMTLHSLLLGHHLYDPLTISQCLQCWSNWWDFLWLHYSFSASLDLVGCLPSIIVVLIGTEEYWHLDLILWGSASCQDPFLQGPPICWSPSWCDWSISLIPPSSAPIPSAPSELFQSLRHHHCGDGLLLTNVGNMFNLYDGCNRF
jgi:hypothetical protein